MLNPTNIIIQQKNLLPNDDFQNNHYNERKTYVQEDNKDFILLKIVEKQVVKKDNIVQIDDNGNLEFEENVKYTLQLKNIDKYFKQSSACCRQCFDHSYEFVLPKELNNIMHTGGYIKTKKVLDDVLNNNSYSFFHLDEQEIKAEKAKVYFQKIKHLATQPKDTANTKDTAQTN